MRLNNTYSTHIASKYVLQRELGLRFPLGFRDRLYHQIYSSLQPSGFWDCSLSTSNKSGNPLHGGVFNLEYSPDGSTLIAACEQKSFIVLDPVTRKDVHHKYNAHSDCVNCVRFLDSRTFATCSDDTTVALWDIRNLKQKMRTLRGHSNWVKNIEFAREEGFLVTSGFDGCIFTWDINNYTEQGMMSQRVFHTNGLMRMRLTPDNKKMILCTAGGYLMVIHNLQFSTLSQDLSGFKPNMYRLMQISQTPISIATSFSHLFASRRNRVELIADWPYGNQAEVISALQVHPSGWCVVSRNTSNGDQSEWTCVHDIQDVPTCPTSVSRKRPRDDGETLDRPSTPQATPSRPSRPSSSSSSSSDVHSDEDGLVSTATSAYADSRHGTQQVEVRITAPLEWGARPGEGAGFHVRVESRDRQGGDNATNPAEESATENNLEFRIPSEEVLEAMELIRRGRNVDDRHRRDFRVQHRVRSRRSSQQASGSTESPRGSTAPARSEAAITVAGAETGEPSADWEATDPNSTAHFVRAVADLAARSVHLLDPFRLRSRNGVRRHPPSLTYDSASDLDMKIHANLDRLTHFVEEPNVGKGYIKELCFSPDGRVIASPFGNGVRLLTFNHQCADMSFNLKGSVINGNRCHGVDKEPAYTLHELTSSTSHSDVVVTTKFSPIHPVFVSGCLGGKIIWHQPLL